MCQENQLSVNEPGSSLDQIQIHDLVSRKKILESSQCMAEIDQINVVRISMLNKYILIERKHT